MSKALGAAFLNHQVEVLQKSVSQRPRAVPGIKMNYARAVDPHASRGRSQAEVLVQNEVKQPVQSGPAPRNQSTERNEKKVAVPTKDADIVVVDTSVLVHGIGHLKAWCKNGREEVVIVPLEGVFVFLSYSLWVRAYIAARCFFTALNTLDLLKKGTSPLAQRARTASRVLEQQVGANPRIRVQRDEAYVPWDDITFTDADDANMTAADELKEDISATPEWLRRTISCACWELEHANESLAAPPNTITPSTADPSDVSVVVAVCLESVQVSERDTPNANASPVPSKAPSPPSKYESRCSGALVAQWAKYSGIRVLECKVTPFPGPAANSNRDGPRHGQGHHGHGHNRNPSSDEEWRATSAGSPVRSVQSGSGAGQKAKFGSIRGKNNGSDSYTKRAPTNGQNVFGPGRAGGGGLVERPASTRAMNASMLQTSKPIRLLARGEKLDP